MRDQNILSIRGVRFGYGKHSILQGIDLTIPQGSIFGYLGKNGAGKSTTIKILLGLLPITEGDIFFHGKNLKDAPLLLRSSVGSMIEHPCFYPFLSVEENLRYLNTLSPMERTRIAEVLSMVGLKDHAQKKAHSLSSGLKQRLGLAMTLFHRPEMLILDEPLNALDPQGIYELRLILQKLNKEDGVTIFLSSHILDELEKVADLVAIIGDGKILYQGSIEELSKKQANKVRFKVNDTSRITQGDYLSVFPSIRVCDSQNFECEINTETDFAKIIEKLCKDQISIYGIHEKRSLLEDAFIHLTE